MVGRYPASLSRKSAGPSRPQRPHSIASSSIDDEVPAAPELPPLPQPQQAPPKPLPELASLEHLLRQAGYKETRVFTPESERTRPRLKKCFDDEQSAELANMYAAMGLDPEASIQVRHLTQPAVPFRSSSSVLRNVALQDATAMLNEVRRSRVSAAPEIPKAADAFWRPEMLGRAAAEAVGKHIVAAISPPRNHKSTDGVGLGLAHHGRGVRKAKSNMELVRQLSRSPEKEDIPPTYFALHRENQPPTAPAHTTAFERQVPPSIAAIFSPPLMTPPEESPVLDDAFNWGQLPSDYESHEADDMYAEMYGAVDDDSDSIISGSSAGTTPSFRPTETTSPPLLDAKRVLADLGLGCIKPIDSDSESLVEAEEIAIAEAEAAAIGQRILASTVEYDDDDDSSDDFDPDCSPTPKTHPILPLPVISVMSPSPPSRTPMLAGSPTHARRSITAVRAPAKRAAPPIRTPRRVTSRADCLAEAMSESIISPLKASKPVIAPASPLRTSKSVPALRKSKSQALFAITPAALAAPARQTVTPVVCDSISNDAEDLPPLPIPPMNDEPEPSSGFGSLALRARKSLGALRASFWATAPPELPPLPSTSTAPILAPRLDWAAQGRTFAGWNTDQDEKQGKRGSIDSTSSLSTMHELADPFDDSDPIDYTKSFFYKPTTPPRSSGGPSRVGKLNKQASVKSLRRALLIPVAAPPVPKIPGRFLTASRVNLSQYRANTPPGTPRLPVRLPEIHLHSPGAIEEGRPPRPLSLDGAEWEGHDVVPNWGEGVTRKINGRSKKRLRKRIPFEDDDFA